MKKLISCIPIFIFLTLLVACQNSFQSSTNSTNNQQRSPSSKQTVLLKGEQLTGTLLNVFDEQGRKLELKIQNVELDPEDADRDTYLYTVAYHDRTDSQWKNLCLPDRQGMAKAIPLTGTWDAKGNHHESDTLVTFACTNGALAKCVRAGYKPWKIVDGRSLRDFHQACTRMIRADYSGDGTGHTRDGTPINMYDVLGIQKKDAESVEPGMTFEAAWSPDGATCLNHPRYSETWAEIQKASPSRLRERVNQGQRCSTATNAQKNWSNSLIFNDSIPQ